MCLEKMRERWMKRHPIICGECGKIVTLQERRERDGIRFHRACAQKRAKSGIENSGYVSSVAVNLKPDCFTVRS